MKNYICVCADVECNSPKSFFLSFFSGRFCALTVVAEGYCCTLSLSVTHTHTIGRNPLDEGSARCRDLYLTTHNTHNRQTSIPPTGFEPAIPASERPQTRSLDRAASHILTGSKIVWDINL